MGFDTGDRFSVSTAIWGGWYDDLVWRMLEHEKKEGVTGEVGVREPKLSGRRKMQVCRWLAERKYTQTQIAEMLDVVPQAVNNFAKRNADVIQEIRDNIEDEMAGKWIAQKKERITYLQSVAERFEDSEDPQEARVGLAAIKQAAEEMGQLPSRLTVVQTPQEITYRVEGIEKDDVT